MLIPGSLSLDEALTWDPELSPLPDKAPVFCYLIHWLWFFHDYEVLKTDSAWFLVPYLFAPYSLSAILAFPLSKLFIPCEYYPKIPLWDFKVGLLYA